VKGNAATAGTRVILLTQGGGAERARGLDLGADEVLTSPWEAAELLARVRVQLREKHAFDELREKTRIADEGREMAQTAFQALAVTEKMTRDAFSLGRALKIGVSVLFAVAMLIAGIFLLYSRRADKEANRAYSVIAQLERGAHRQEQLMADARSARADLKQSDVLEQKQQLKNIDRKSTRLNSSHVAISYAVFCLKKKKKKTKHNKQNTVKKEIKKR